MRTPNRTLPAIRLSTRAPAAHRSGHRRGLGVLLFLEGESVRFCAAHGALTPALRQAISERGPELAALLRRGL